MQSVCPIGKESLPPLSVVNRISGPQYRKKVNEIVQSFNTWAFKREQPSDLALLTRFATRAMMRQEPLSFVLYWGKGPRSGIETPDIQCLDYLASLAARVRSVYGKGTSINLILTDTHAALNGHPAQEITRYFNEIASEARNRSFDCYLLSELTEAAGHVVEPEDCQLPSETTLQLLANSAMRWYRGGGTPEEGARKYYLMNMVEKRVIEIFFPSSIFITFNGREHRELFPDKLPIFYMYSLRRGTSVKPWFLPDPEPQPAALAG
jgi:hypothetical protein